MFVIEVGIVSYGVYIPRWRIKVEEIARIWGHDSNRLKERMLVDEKSVHSLDEDTITMSVEASRNALKRSPQIDRQKIGALYVGSESHPYAVKPSATIVAEAIGITPILMAADLEFACKAGTAGIQACMGLVKGGYIKYGISIGADTAQGRPGDALEYTASSGAAAYIIGKDHLIAQIEGTYSSTEDIPDFWRREGADYPRHGGRFTGRPAYFTQVINSTRGLMDKLGSKPEDYDYAVFHEPNGRFPLTAAKILGFSKEKIIPGLLVTKIGNTYSASSIIALARILDQSKSGDRILVTSYGSGAGSDSFSLRVTDRIETCKVLAPLVDFYVQQKEHVDYALYSKFKRQFKGFVG